MIKAGIVGGTGYTGAELLRLLTQHPKVEVTCITSRQEIGMRVDRLFPNLRGYLELSFADPSTNALRECDVIFFATPHGVSMEHIPRLWDSKARFIDLGADFRLKSVALFEKWYHTPHTSQTQLTEAVYGLPELNREQIRRARLIANPGCYPTATALGLLPILEDHTLDIQQIIVDAKSGVSGAGRSASVGNLLCEASESIKAYNISGHRHWPEIQQTIKSVSGKSKPFIFTPHLTPMIRGILATIYVSLDEKSVKNDPAYFQSLYEKRYEGEPFVDVLEMQSHPTTKQVSHSNFCHLALHYQPENKIVIILSVIDNLIKGASGQAIQNMNLMFGLAETLGLEQCPQIP